MDVPYFGEEHECRCQECQDMCEIPCIGTPEEMLAIMDRFGTDNLEASKFPRNWETMDWRDTVALVVSMDEYMDMGYRCRWQLENGDCELHSLGLKPVEGRIAIHGLSTNKRGAIVQTWDTPIGAEVVAKFYKLLAGD